MSRVYHYDTTYEQEAEDGTVTASVELRIYYTVIPAGGDDWNEPRYDAQAEYHSTSAWDVYSKDWRLLTRGRGMADDALMDWAEDFVADHQDALLIAAGERDEIDAEAAIYARELRAEQRQEDRS